MERLKSREEKEQQIKKETRISLLLYVGYFLWWYITGYGFAKGDPSGYHYILGLPTWFFMSCIVGYIWFCIATVIVVKKVFRNFSLDDEEEGENGEI